MIKNIMKQDNNDLGKKVFKKLSWYLDQKLPIHFCLLDKFGWKNGDIIDLNEEKLTLVLKEFKKGELPFLLEEIDINTIKQFNKPIQDDNDLGEKVFRKLSWYYIQKLPIHFCLLDKFGWKNGDIIDLNEEKLTLVLKEFKEGELSFLLKEININTIKQFTKPISR